MSDLKKFIQAQQFQLAGSGVSLSDTSIILKSFKLPNSQALITNSDLGTINYATLEGGTAREEAISFTGVTQNADGTATITGVIRGLKFVAPYDQDLSLRDGHGGGTSFVITNGPGFYNEFTSKVNDETIEQLWSFIQNPQKTSDTLAANNRDFVTKNDLIAAALGTVAITGTVQSGTSGEAIALGKLCYLKTSDNRWWKSDAATPATFNGVQLGISQTAPGGAGVSMNVLPFGVDVNQSGLTPGAKYYLSDTAGAISATAGTNAVFVGWALTATTLLFVRNNDINGPTANEKAAMAGTSGTPSVSNKFVTDVDTTGTGDLIRNSVLFNSLFSNGADGVILLDGTNTYPTMFSKSGSTYTQLRDVFPTTFTLNNGVILQPANFRIRASVSVALNGTVNANGNNGSNGGVGGNGENNNSASQAVGGTGGNGGATINPNGFFITPAGSAGGSAPLAGAITPSSNGGNGGAGATVMSTYGSAQGAGVNGAVGTNSSAGLGGTAGAITSPVFNRLGSLKEIIEMVEYSISFVATRILGHTGSAGGGSGGSGTGSGSWFPSNFGAGGGGGGAGSNGGIFMVVAPLISGNATINLNGGNGGNGGAGGTGSNGNGGQGGGGNGGNGGHIIFVYQEKTFSGTTNLAGGNGGTGANTGTNGLTGAVVNFSIS
jgi:hypothetical protein